MNTLQQVILTLQYCLETFEQACQCRRCDPCTKGQRDLHTAIGTINALLSSRTTTNLLYVLERPSARAEFAGRSALTKFVMELAVVPSLFACAEASLDEVATIAARNSWQLFELPTLRDACSASGPAAKRPEHRCLETLVSAHQLISYPSEYGHFNSAYEEAKSTLERHASIDELYVVQYSGLDGAPAFACALPTQISDRGPFYLTDICAVVCPRRD